ncbi:MAG: nucleotide sugar dehydrogenase [Spiribacter salinus]|uniref:Nucleotide sugar dehydrogenase n=1 Tax=Spiribacter salinus TaxID=1335746 RepID=A0A540VTS1_9GAMM|nr:MAG: nucleotide sugar dehydrogenase [Spiribacter salinus]
MSVVSESPITGVEYQLPKGAENREAIDEFVGKNPGKPVVAVQGLGFVGAVMSLVCANAHGADYAVLGVDLPKAETYWRIRSLNEGLFPLTAEDPKIEEFFERAQAQGNFYATFDPYAYAHADVIIVDINLDVDKEASEWRDLTGYDVDLSGFREAIKAIGDNCKEDVLVLVETTVPPGTCQKVVRPILEGCLRERGLSTERFRLGHSYERVMPGPNYVDSIRNFPRVYAGVDDKSADATEAFLRTIIDTEQCKLTRLEDTNATEMAKVLENAYRAMNIAFVVEWSRFAEEAGVDLYEVVRAIRQRPTHANLMLPGIGVGGYCLTKDPLLASWARQELFGGDGPLVHSERAVAVNDKMPEYAYNFLRQEFGDLAGARVALFGVSYRGEVGDTRSTPVELFYECLASAGATILAHDPYVTHWAEKDLPVSQDLEGVLERRPDVVVLSTGHRMYARDETIDQLMARDGLFVYDTIGVLSAEQIVRLRERHTVKVLGRGDL